MAFCRVMRTTITIDDEVLEQLEARAAREGTTVSNLGLSPQNIQH